MKEKRWERIRRESRAQDEARREAAGVSEEEWDKAKRKTYKPSPPGRPSHDQWGLPICDRAPGKCKRCKGTGWISEYELVKEGDCF